MLNHDGQHYNSDIGTIVTMIFRDFYLLRHVGLGQLLPLGLHGEADQVVGADPEQLLRLRLLRLGLHHQQRDGEQERAETED